MPTPHKHRDVIIAWANGEQIQWRNTHSSYWRDWEGGQTPAFGIPDNEYRIKPKPLVRYMAVVAGTMGPCSSNLYATYRQVVDIFREQGKPFTVYQLTLEEGKIVSCEEVK